MVLFILIQGNINLLLLFSKNELQKKKGLDPVDIVGDEEKDILIQKSTQGSQKSVKDTSRIIHSEISSKKQGRNISSKSISSKEGTERKKLFQEKNTDVVVSNSKENETKRNIISHFIPQMHNFGKKILNSINPRRKTVKENINKGKEIKSDNERRRYWLKQNRGKQSRIQLTTT